LDRNGLHLILLCTGTQLAEGFGGISAAASSASKFKQGGGGGKDQLLTSDAARAKAKQPQQPQPQPQSSSPSLDPLNAMLSGRGERGRSIEPRAHSR